MIAEADVLALLEDGPHSVAELAGWLKVPAAELERALAGMPVQRCEQCQIPFIRQPGTRGRFCSRTCYKTPATSPNCRAKKGGRLPWVDHQARQATILTLLQGQPHTIGGLALALHCSKWSAKADCQALAARGAAKVVKIGLVATWAVAGWTPSATAPIARGTPGQQPATTAAAVFAQLQDGPASASAIAERLRVSPKAVRRHLRVLAAAGTIKGVGAGNQMAWAASAWEPPRPPDPPAPPARTAAADGTALRQAPAASSDRGPSWWVGKDRAALNAEARARHGEMRASREALYVRDRLLQ